MSRGKSTQEKPYPVEVKAGETYYWCACGLSAKQPFCDGTHKGTGMSPQSFVAEKDGPVYLCGCRRSGKQPFCDGTHKNP